MAKKNALAYERFCLPPLEFQKEAFKFNWFVSFSGKRKTVNKTEERDSRLVG